MDFVELDRDFAQLKKDEPASLDVGRRWGRKVGGWQSWPDLLSFRRVILLAEAASGKTREFLNRQKLLQAEDEFAFFLRIEELADQGLVAALAESEIQAFDRWRASTASAWFFLDSLDEARLVGKKFHTALKRFARELEMTLGRAHIFISCRVTDWRGQADYDEVADLLPVRKPAALPQESAVPVDPLLDPIFVEKPKATGARKATKIQGDPDMPIVVQLAPLRGEQCRDLAKAAGINDIEAFAQAIARQGLEPFTERPGDVLDLVDYWRAKGRFGSFEEMVGFSISKKLTEAHSDRADNNLLTVAEAHEGASQIAAALTFGKAFTLRAPNHDSDPSLAAGALDAAAILPDWTEAKRNALLRRGIFPPATYGRVRFHHRSSQEYLAADWLDRLLTADCPKDEIWHLLFVERYGVKTIAPSLRPTAAWLALRYPDFRDEIMRREPLILIHFGDPGSLSIPVRENLLKTYAAKYATGDVVVDPWEIRSLWMFADQRLSDTIARLWEEDSQTDFRWELLKLIRDGAIKDCARFAREIALYDRYEWHRRSLALDALIACEDGEGLSAAAQGVLQNPKEVDSRLAAVFARDLYPRYLSTQDLLILIRDSIPAPKGSTAGFSHLLHELYEKAPNTEERRAFIEGLADLCLSPPYIEFHQRVSMPYRFIAKQMHEIAFAELNRPGTKEPTQEIVRMLMVTERIAPQSRTLEDDKSSLHDLIQHNPALYRALFWADLAEDRAAQLKSGQSQPIRFWQIFLNQRSLWSFGPEDRDWLREQMIARDNDDDRRVLLSALISTCGPGGEREVIAERVRPIIANSDVLAADMAGYLEAPVEAPEVANHRRRMEAMEAKKAAQTEKDRASWRQFADELNAEPTLLSDAKYLASWKAGIFRHKHLLHWLQNRSGALDGGALRNWQQLEEGFGATVAKEFRQGLSRLWRLIPPQRPEHKDGGVITTSWTIVLAFGAIGVEATENPNWASQLTAKEAERAIEHGCISEQGYPEWIDEVGGAFPEILAPLLKKVIVFEWSLTYVATNPFLNHYAFTGVLLSPLIQDVFIDAVLAAEAGQHSTLDLSIRIIRKLELTPNQRKALKTKTLSRMNAHQTEGNDEFAFRYMAILFIIEPDTALVELERYIEGGNPKIERAEVALSALFRRHDSLSAGELHRMPLTLLEKLLHLTYRNIRMIDDIHHEGSFTPGRRDEAEGARDSILSAIIERPGADAFAIIRRAGSLPDFSHRAKRFAELAKLKAERDAEAPPWLPSEIVALRSKQSAVAKTGDDLFRVILGVLRDINLQLTRHDFSSRSLLERAQVEDDVQKWLAEQVNFLAKGRYHTHRETEIALGDKPDIIVSSTSAQVEVAIEVKHGGKPWTLRQLEDALKSQLATDYLKPDTRRHGVLVVSHHRDRFWLDPADKRRMTFDDVIDHLSKLAEEVTRSSFGAVNIACVGINALSPSRQ